MKALIPAAGHGTRFAPFTKLVPKEMLPIGARPAIALIVDEAIEAGADEVVIITSPEKAPDDPALNLRLGSVYALQNDWQRALPALAKSNSPLAKPAAQELEAIKQSNNAKNQTISAAALADAWWSVELPKKDAQLQSSLRAHAADLYKLSLPDLTGLTKVQAERRIKETESVVTTAEKSDSKSSMVALSGGAAQHVGVKLVGQVKNNNGILSGFVGNSYALIEPEFSPAAAPIEAVVEFTTGDQIAATFGVMGGVGNADGFTPFYVVGAQAVGFLSSSGKVWDLASNLPVGVPVQAKSTYRLKCSWDGKGYTWSVWRGKWIIAKELPNVKPVYGGLQLQLGTNRGQNSPLVGTIDLNKCYIKVGGKLWWEGVKGAYKNANK